MLVFLRFWESHLLPWRHPRRWEGRSPAAWLSQAAPLLDELPETSLWKKDRFEAKLPVEPEKATWKNEKDRFQNRFQIKTTGYIEIQNKSIVLLWRLRIIFFGNHQVDVEHMNIS